MKRRTTRRPRTLLLLVAVLLVTGCGADGAARSPAAPMGGTEIEISGIAFKPEGLTVAAGAEVTWTNHDATRHTVTAGTPEMPDAEFDAPLDQEGDAFSHTFDAAGSYPFFCRVHPNGMRGEITVG